MSGNDDCGLDGMTKLAMIGLAVIAITIPVGIVAIVFAVWWMFTHVSIH